MFSGEAVAVPQVYCSRLRTLALPPHWQKRKAYAPRWFLPDPKEEGIDLEEHNLSVAKTGDATDFAWLVKSIRSVHLAREGAELRELCYLSWKPCWIPLSLVHKTAHPLFPDSLQEAKKRFQVISKKRQVQLARYIHPQILRFLRSFEKSPWQLFYVFRAAEYAQVTQDNTPVELVRVEFCHTYEHCSCLIASADLWREMNQRRVEAAQRMIKLETDQEGRGLYRTYLEMAKRQLETGDA